MNLIERVARRGRRLVHEALISSEARAIRQERLTYLSAEKLRRLERTAAQVLRDGVQGEIVEFGVALGGSAILLAEHALSHGRSFHGFDVFGMIPPPTDNDGADVKDRYEVIASGRSEGIAGDAYYGYRDDLLGDVTRAFASHGVTVDGEAVALHKGLFEETWPEFGARPVAFAHIDCDWYDPVRFCLERMGAQLSVGGAAILDDYHDYESCRRATDEFLAARPDFAMEDGANVILRRIGRPS